MPCDSGSSNDEIAVLVVGAGPTGLTLACQLVRFGVRFRIIDKQVDRIRESRALAVQARSLEVLQALGRYRPSGSGRYSRNAVAEPLA